MSDEWKIVPGYERFSVTADARVRRNEMRINRIGRWGKPTTYVWKQRMCYIGMHQENGYKRVSVSTGKRRFPVYVHRLVALAWVPGYEPGYHVNHINGQKLDNRAENLEWVPLEENVRHAWRTGLTGAYGEDNATSVLTWKKVEAIRRALSHGVNVNTISILADVSNETIRRIKDGVSWKDAHG